jgi:hypothetical protein
LKIGFKVIRRLVVKAGVAALVVVVGDVVGDFQSRFRQPSEVAAVK